MPQPQNGRTTRKKKESPQEPPSEEQKQFTPLGENQLVSEVDIECVRLRGQNALLEAQLLTMRNELIKAKQEIERLVSDGKDKEGKAGDK